MADVLTAADAVADPAASPGGRAASAPLMADPMPMALRAVRCADGGTRAGERDAGRHDGFVQAAFAVAR